MAKHRLLGVRLGDRSLPQLIDAADAAMASSERPFVFACANPHSLVVARTDAAFRAALEAADVVVADGVGCRWGATLSGATIGPRITGFDFFLGVMAAVERRGGRVYFLGSRDAVLRKIIDKVAEDFPHIGTRTLSPPFGDWSRDVDDELVRSIREFAPHVLWVGMTAPKQEKWVAAHAARLGVPVIGSIGAVFDYYPGVTQRAPQWICDLGLEWAYRLPREPRRLWRRTFISAPQFLWYSLLDRARP